MKEHKGSFRNLVTIARADGDISEIEYDMLIRVARRLNLREDQVKEILDNPTLYPVQPPTNILERRERLVDLVWMVMVDGEIDSREMATLERCAISLGYKSTDIPALVNRIHHFILQGLDRSGVIEAMLSEQA
ncbi:MAG: TerB family tellurite resistance protein [Flavobacteriales bacterium]|nr:TerB family tellurite resistance protein [Flavobacteriales bacterium]